MDNVMEVLVMIRRILCCLPSLLILIGAFIQNPHPLFAEPSIIPEGNEIDIYFGDTVKDPYRSFENPGEVERKWIDEQDAYARAFAEAAPHHESLVKELAAISGAGVYSPPLSRGSRLFFSEFEPTGPQRAISILEMDSHSSKLRTLVDRYQFERETRMFPSRFFCSDNGHIVAFTASLNGSVWERLYFYDVRAGRRLSDTLENIHARLTSINWSPDHRGFYYEAYERVGDSGVGSARLLYHVLGRPQPTDQVIYDPHDRDIILSAASSPGGRYLVISERRNSDSGNRILAKRRDATASAVYPIVEDATATFVYAGQVGSRGWFRTDLNAPNGRVVSIDLERTHPHRIQETIPESEDPINTWIGMAPLGTVVAGNHILVTRTLAGSNSVKVYSMNGKEERQLHLPYEGSIWTGFVGDENKRIVYYSLSGLLDPGSVYTLDTTTGKSTLFHAPDLPYSLDNFVTELAQVPANDGQKIPVFIVRRKDSLQDGHAPAALYGYGFGGWNASPYFYPLMADFVNHGGVWAVAMLRGDGGFGTKWHLAGRRLNKPRAIEDYLDVTRWLLAQHYTAQDRMIANASSAGAALVAAAVTQNPELYGALILDYPLIDVLRYDRFTYARNWIPEYGTSSDEADYKILRSYSPYHNLSKGNCYPATFLAPGENDGLTPPFHAYKFAAALQADSICSKPVLLRLSRGAGHSAGADLQQSISNWADQLSFLERILPDGLD